MGSRSLGLLLIGVGVAALVIGALVNAGAMSWFGRLPGDIRIESGNSRFYFPITSMIVISVILTVIVNVVRRLF